MRRGRDFCATSGSPLRKKKAAKRALTAFRWPQRLGLVESASNEERAVLRQHAATSSLAGPATHTPAYHCDDMPNGKNHSGNKDTTVRLNFRVLLRQGGAWAEFVSVMVEASN